MLEVCGGCQNCCGLATSSGKGISDVVFGLYGVATALV